jgi:NAD(P)H dehydrogenase (quinone)
LVRIAVTGSTGKLGGQVVRLLAATGAHQVVALARRQVVAESAVVTSTYAEYNDLASLRSALRGADVLVFVSSDGEAAKMMIHHQNVVKAATENEVAHVVYLSGLDADLASPFCYAYTNGYTEQILAESGCAVSIARASLYIEFFSHFLTPARTTGVIRLPAVDGKISLVSREDVARCLAALAAGPATGRHHDMTGRESLDLNAIARITSRVWDTPIQYADISPAQFGSDLASAGEESWWSYAYSSLFASIREQRWAALTDEAEQLIGRPQLTLADVLAQAE